MTPWAVADVNHVKAVRGARLATGSRLTPVAYYRDLPIVLTYTGQ